MNAPLHPDIEALFQSAQDLQNLIAKYDSGAGKIEPNTFVRWTCAQTLTHREPNHEKMAKNWGLTIPEQQHEHLRYSEDFNEILWDAIQTKQAILNSN